MNLISLITLVSRTRIYLHILILNNLHGMYFIQLKIKEENFFEDIICACVVELFF